jgi:hypothetical protein
LAKRFGGVDGGWSAAAAAAAAAVTTSSTSSSSSELLSAKEVLTVLLFFRWVLMVLEEVSVLVGFFDFSGCCGCCGCPGFFCVCFLFENVVAAAEEEEEEEEEEDEEEKEEEDDEEDDDDEEDKDWGFDFAIDGGSTGPYIGREEKDEDEDEEEDEDTGPACGWCRSLCCRIFGGGSYALIFLNTVLSNAESWLSKRSLRALLADFINASQLPSPKPSLG